MLKDGTLFNSWSNFHKLWDKGMKKYNLKVGLTVRMDFELLNDQWYFILYILQLKGDPERTLEISGA